MSLPTYEFSDQPSTCPYCGARTEFTEDEGSELYRELHTCPVCKQQHWREEPEDD